MATEQLLSSITIEAGSDLSSDIYKIVAVASDGQVDLAGAGVHAQGVLQNNPDAAGKAATVGIFGVSKVILGATVAAGAKIMVDASGLAITATATNHVIGTCLAGGAVNEVGEILLGSSSHVL